MDDLEFGSRFDEQGILNEEESTGTTPRSSLSFQLPQVGLSFDEEEKKKSKKKGKDTQDNKTATQADFLKAQQQNMMVIGLSGNFSSGSGAASAPAAPVEEEDEEENVSISKAESRELLKFLQESINEYAKYVRNIGRNGLAASNLNYYRDDIQDVLDYIKYDKNVNLKDYWGEIVKLDLQLRGKAPMHVREIGYENFKQYQIINDPPLTHWWWYLNRMVAPPAAKGPKFWEIWKK